MTEINRQNKVVHQINQKFECKNFSPKKVNLFPWELEVVDKIYKHSVSFIKNCIKQEQFVMDHIINAKAVYDKETFEINERKI